MELPASAPEPDARQGTLLAVRYRLAGRLHEHDGSAAEPGAGIATVVCRGGRPASASRSTPST